MHSKRPEANNNEKMNISEIIKENFFIIDSNNLDEISSHMYGFSISKKGILTDNYYKELGLYEDPEPQGIYIMIRKIGNKITINQDFYGSFGIYFYENKNSGYFALSNSFLLLEEYLKGKETISLNKDFSNTLIISQLCSPSIYETMINEINILPPDTFISIDISKRIYNICNIDYKENSIPFDSKEGLEIIDKWVDKWGYIIRSLKKKTDNISSDLTGGFDTRAVLSLLLNSGIDLNEILINSSNDSLHCHSEDFQIASNISLKFGFKLNNKKLDRNGTIWRIEDNLASSFYTKLGFHKEFYFKNKFFTKPRFSFSGSGGELNRGYPGYPIEKYIRKISSGAKYIKGYEKEFYNSSVYLCNRSINLLKTKNKNNYEISSELYSKGRTRNHYGKSALEGFLANIYSIQPMIDPELKKLKYEISEETTHDLIAYIYIRFGHNLINFPIQGKRILNLKSISKAEKINNFIPPYKKKEDYNENFFIDIRRKSPVIGVKKIKNPIDYFVELSNSSKFIKNINKIYNNSIYNWAIEYSKKTNFFPFRHIYGLLAISKMVEDLSI
jgi:hypothetical protein